MPNNRFINALSGIQQATPPIWLMRQAGRYHSHYQDLKKKHSFMDLCKDPELAAQAALGPVEAFDFDVAILFSDLLFPLEAMGMGLEYTGGPRLSWELTNDTFDRLKPARDAVAGLEFQRQAMVKTRALLPDEKSLIGFVGGPWTLFRYAVNGTHQPAAGGPDWGLWDRFSNHVLPLLTLNIQLQLDGGAEIVMLFDTSAGQVAPEDYRKFLVPSLEHLAVEFPRKLGYYARNAGPEHYGHPWFQSETLAGIGVDSGWDITEALGTFGGVGFVQGNFPEDSFLLPPAEFRAQLLPYLERLRDLGPEGRRGWVCGAGHGLRPGTHEENVHTFVTMTREVLQ